jgi:hypothetical protein
LAKRHPARLPCRVADDGFSVTYTLNKFQPVTVPVQVIDIPGDSSTPASTSRARPGGRRTSAGGPAAQGAENIEAENAKTIQTLGRGTAAITLPRSGAGLGAGHAELLIAWTAPHGGLYAEPIMPRLRVAEP